MTQSDWNTLLTLLAVMVLADGRIHDVERKSFAARVRMFCAFMSDGKDVSDVPSEQAVLAWFDAHAEDARALTRHEPVEVAVLPLLGALKTLPNKQRLLDALAVIADSDLHRAQSEQDILTLAAAFWGLVRPAA